MSLNHFTQSFFELKDVIITNVENIDSTVFIHLEMPRTSHSCPCCGGMTDKVHDYRLQTIKDVPIYKQPTYIKYKRRRYVCPNCNKRFSENNTFVAFYRQHSTRFFIWIRNELENCTSLSNIAKSLKSTITTVSRVIDSIYFSTPKTLPSVIALDEFKGNASTGKYQCIFTDPDNREVLDILPVRTESSLSAYFRRYSREERDSVEYVVIDMWRPYYSVMRHLFPNAKVIIDRFHYIRQLMWGLENTRKRIQKSLTKEDRLYFKRSRKLLLMNSDKLKEEHKLQMAQMFRIAPDLEKAYNLKENFQYYIKQENAKDLFDMWIEQAKESGLPEFKSVITAFTNWGNPIKNSFDVPYSNGFTEGFNNKIKVLKRVSYGIRNFNRFRTRILILAK